MLYNIFDTKFIIAKLILVVPFWEFHSEKLIRAPQNILSLHDSTFPKLFI